MFPRCLRFGFCIAFLLAASSARGGVMGEPLVITEVMHAEISGSGNSTWIEVYNSGSMAVALNDYAFGNEFFAQFGSSFDLLPLVPASSAGTVNLGVGQTAVFFDSSKVSKSDFISRWSVPSSALVFGLQPNSLGGGLIEEDLFLVHNFDIKQSLLGIKNPPFPFTPSGTSLTLNSLADPENPANWIVSGIAGGGGTSGEARRVGTPGLFGTSVVPEPSSTCIFVAIGCVGLVRRRRQKRAS